MDSFTKKLPSHEMIYRALRDKVLFGELAPGQAVTIQGLVEEWQISMTPVREAIRRLTAEGALEFKGNRRVSVPVLGPKRFDELVFARRAIEPHLAEIAAEKITDAEIDLLQEIDAQIDTAIERGDVHAYMQMNYQFHFSLYQRAGTHILLPIAQSLWLRFGPLSRIICGRFGTSNLADRHEEAIAALRAKNPGAVAAAIQLDIEQGFDIVRASFQDQII